MYIESTDLALRQEYVDKGGGGGIIGEFRQK